LSIKTNACLSYSCFRRVDKIEELRLLADIQDRPINAHKNGKFFRPALFRLLMSLSQKTSPYACLPPYPQTGAFLVSKV